MQGFPIFSYLLSYKVFPDNLKYETISEAYSRFYTNDTIKEEYLRFANLDALALISEFDHTGNQRLIDASDALLEWIQSVAPDGKDNKIYKLNRLQIKKRLEKEFSEEDKTFLYENTTEDNLSIAFAVYVLLEIRNKAQLLWDKFSASEQEELKGYPIYYLLKKLLQHN